MFAAAWARVACIGRARRAADGWPAARLCGAEEHRDGKVAPRGGVGEDCLSPVGPQGQQGEFRSRLAVPSTAGQSARSVDRRSEVLPATRWRRCAREGLQAFALTLSTTMALSMPQTASAQALTPQRQQQLTRTVRQDCGSCHGMRLSGGLGPALTREALAGKPVEALAATIYHGRPGTPMPGWRNMLSEQDAQWIAQQLSAGFPEERTPEPVRHEAAR